jgi:hypothetical protein
MTLGSVSVAATEVGPTRALLLPLLPEEATREAEAAERRESGTEREGARLEGGGESELPEGEI